MAGGIISKMIVWTRAAYAFFTKVQQGFKSTLADGLACGKHDRKSRMSF
jgi:hypothetical protein